MPHLVHGAELLHSHWGNRAYILFFEAFVVLCSDDSELQAIAILLACYKMATDLVVVGGDFCSTAVQQMTRGASTLEGTGLTSCFCTLVLFSRCC